MNLGEYRHQSKSQGERARDYLRVAEVAQELGVSEKLVRASIKRGDLPAYNFGERGTRVRRTDLIEWQENRRIVPKLKSEEEVS